MERIIQENCFWELEIGSYSDVEISIEMQKVQANNQFCKFISKIINLGFTITTLHFFQTKYFKQKFSLKLKKIKHFILY